MALVSVLMAAGFAAVVAGNAENDRHQDVSRALVSEAKAIRDKEPYRSLLLGIEAYRIAPTPEAEKFLLDARMSFQMIPLECGGADPVCHKKTVRVVVWGEGTDGTDVLATAGDDGRINIWRTPRGESRPVYEKVFDHDGPVQSAALSADGSTLLTAGADGSIRVWDVADGEDEVLASGDGHAVNGIAFHPANGDVVASAGKDGVVRLWSRASGEPVVEIPDEGNPDPVYAVAFSPDSKLLATAHGDGTVRLWDVRDLLSSTSASREPFADLSSQTEPHPARVLAFSPDSETLAIGVAADVLLCETAYELLRGRSGRIKCQRASGGANAGQVQALVFSPGTGNKALTGGDTLLVGGDDASSRLLDATNLGLRSLYTGPTDNILGVAFSPDGKTIAAVGANAVVGLWAVQAGLEDETGDDNIPPSRADDPEDVIDWVCTRYHPTSALLQWPESISREFYRPIC